MVNFVNFIKHNAINGIELTDGVYKLRCGIYDNDSMHILSGSDNDDLTGNYYFAISKDNGITWAYNIFGDGGDVDNPYHNELNGLNEGDFQHLEMAEKATIMDIVSNHFSEYWETDNLTVNTSITIPNNSLPISSVINLQSELNSAKQYSFQITSSSTEWIINNPYPRPCSVYIIDSANSELEADVTFSNDFSIITINFSNPTSGWVILN